MHENRETSLTSEGDKPAERWVKVRRNTYRNVSEESDSVVVPMKISNKGGKAPAERLEGRPGTKENARRPYTPPTQSGKSVPQGLEDRLRVLHERIHRGARAITTLWCGMRIASIKWKRRPEPRAGQEQDGTVEIHYRGRKLSWHAWPNVPPSQRWPRRNP